jgi:HEAT repeat protein
MLDQGQLRSQIQDFQGTDAAVRRQAVQVLKQYERQDWDAAPQGMVDGFVQAIQHELLHGVRRAMLRQSLLKILGNIGPASAPAVQPLVGLLQESTSDALREEVVIALGKIGAKAKSAAPLLFKMLPGCRALLAVQVILALNGIVGSDPKAGAALIELWLAPDHSSDSRMQVALALCKLGLEAKGLLPFLTHILASKQQSSIQQLAAEGLGWRSQNEVEVIPLLLLSALQDADEKLRQIAENSLKRLGLSHENAVALCAGQLKDSRHAEAALQKSGLLAVSVLIQALAGRKSPHREKIARILGHLGELAAPAVPALTLTLGDKNPHVRLAVAKSLWNITRNAGLTVPVLIDLLETSPCSSIESADARRQFLQTIIEALGRIGPAARAAIPALKKKVKDGNRLVSESAICALTVIAPAGGNPWSLSMNREEPGND